MKKLFSKLTNYLPFVTDPELDGVAKRYDLSRVKYFWKFTESDKSLRKRVFKKIIKSA